MVELFHIFFKFSFSTALHRELFFVKWTFLRTLITVHRPQICHTVALNNVNIKFSNTCTVHVIPKVHGARSCSLFYCWTVESCKIEILSHWCFNVSVISTGITFGVIGTWTSQIRKCSSILSEPFKVTFACILIVTCTLREKIMKVWNFETKNLKKGEVWRSSWRFHINCEGGFGKLEKSVSYWWILVLCWLILVFRKG